MSPVFEMVVRREHALFTPTFHVTVATMDPPTVVEVFEFQPGQVGLAAAAESAMQQLRRKGYRLTEAVEVHDSHAIARLALDERQAANVELAADLVADARAVARALADMGTREGAAAMVQLIGDLMASGQALKARADAVLSADQQVEAAAVFDDAMSQLDPHQAALAEAHAELQRRRTGGVR